MSKILSFGQPMGAIMQVAYVVEDIEKAMKEWTDTLGVGPFFLFEHFALDDYRYRGKPGDIDITLALGFSGSMCFELIVQHSNAPSVYTEVTDNRGYGFHHWAISTDSFDNDLARHVAAGNSEVLYGKVPDPINARAAYVDTMAKTGGMIELIEMTPAVEGFFSALKEPSVNWDGKDPVRTLG
ncbi:hypothetical protein MNBD_ALPHA02-1577 [hydrothermal vent metagenome]|uniref:VOC domain-containing protein n=1 Tax=hydrothermal vent metagenome TaxID=652676 RepID=A0A3B0RF59_9ZZZZ